jgi:hypothetical protein
MNSPGTQTIERESSSSSFSSSVGDQVEMSTGGKPSPKFGGMYGNAVWIGGIPDTTFTKTINANMQSPMCVRSDDPNFNFKLYTKRVEDGIDSKFKRDNAEYTLMSFANDALKHMQKHGMDTVFYMQGATDEAGTGAMELFTYHTRYTKTAVDEFIAKATKPNGNFDDVYCKEALHESGQWLVNCLDESLKTTLRNQLAANPTGPQVWMLIVGEIQTTSLRRCKDLADKFEALRLSQFTGENVREYANTAQEILAQLERDDQLPLNHLTDIVDHMSACSVMDFKIYWMTRRTAVEDFVKATLGKDKSVVAAMPNKITYDDLLSEAKEKYINLQKQWGPSPSAEEKALVSKIQALTAQVANLKQNLTSKQGNGSGDGSKRKCNYCGKDGHTEPFCRKKKKDQKGTGNNGGADTNGNKGGNNGGTSSSNGNKWDKPKDGEPHEKEIDGVKHFYCSKCKNGKGRWNKTHTTDNHKTPDQLNAASGGTSPTANLGALAAEHQGLYSQWWE